VVDDEKDIVITLREILEETGSFEVKTFTDQRHSNAQNEWLCLF
jgi:DNA-binding NtrC family response regulator